MHADTATRQHWMSVLAHSQPTELAARLKALNITADYEVIRAAETGLVQIQARMGGTGERFFAGDATLTRAAVRLTDGTLGYSWVLGRDKQHAERCALIDALMQQTRHFQNLSETLIAPLNADRMARIALAHAEHQPVAAREVRRLIRRVDKTVDHFTFGHQQFADVHRKSQLFRHNRHVDIAAADFACERMIASVTTLGGVGQRQQIAFVAAH